MAPILRYFRSTWAHLNVSNVLKDLTSLLSTNNLAHGFKERLMEVQEPRSTTFSSVILAIPRSVRYSLDPSKSSSSLSSVVAVDAAEVTFSNSFQLWIDNWEPMHRVVQTTRTLGPAFKSLVAFFKTGSCKKSFKLTSKLPMSSSLLTLLKS